MTLRIISNKRINLTETEYKLYEEICKAYSRQNFNGKDLFNDLFECDQDGNIIFIRSPQQQFSFEIIIFLQNIMLNQHLRKIYSEHNIAMEELKNLIKDAKEIINEVKGVEK